MALVEFDKVEIMIKLILTKSQNYEMLSLSHNYEIKYKKKSRMQNKVIILTVFEIYQSMICFSCGFAGESLC